MAASRFPGKPLAPILGMPMIEHVRRRVALSKALDEVVVATCDEEIMKVVSDAGGRVIMTSDSHERCTDRIAEAALKIDADVIINVQGDEPLVMPEMLDKVVSPLRNDDTLPSVNLATPITDREEFENPNVVKVVMDRFQDALYFSREPIPSGKKACMNNYLKLKQLGIIAFRSDFLQDFTRLEPTPIEKIESVDMMRALEHGYRVKIITVESEMIGVDVPGDIGRVEKALVSDPLVKEYR